MHCRGWEEFGHKSLHESELQEDGLGLNSKEVALFDFLLYSWPAASVATSCVYGRALSGGNI